MTQSLDLLAEIPCYKCIILEPVRAPLENCAPSQCQALTEWIMQEAQKPQTEQEAVKTTKRKKLALKLHS